jgi:hypothetical protein
MPPPLNVNRESIKTLVIAHGVAEAHRLTGIPLGTIKAWSARFKWLKSKPDPIVQPLCNRSPADALAATLQADNEATKLGLSKAAVKTAKHAARMTPVQVLNVSRDLKNVTDIAEKVHGWNQGQGRGTNVFANQAVVIDDATIDELQARLARLRGESA